MSLGFRITRRGRLALPACSPAASPLLFLYPRWFSTSGPQENGQTIRREQSSILVPDEAVQHDITRPQVLQLQSQGNVTEGNPPRSINKPKASANGELKLRRVQVKEVRLAQRDHLLAKAREKTRTSAAAKDAAKLSLQTVKQNEREWAQKQTGKVPWSPTWASIYALLDKHTPGSDIWKEISVAIPDIAAPQLLFGAGENIWDIGRIYDCVIELKSEEDSEEATRRLLIFGPAPAIIKAAAHILRVVSKMTLEHPAGGAEPQILRVPSFSTTRPSKESGIIRRHVQSFSRTPRPILKQRADQIPRPLTWTPGSFTDFVRLLTSAIVSSHLHPRLYPDKGTHQEIVIRILLQIFKDPRCASAVTLEASHEAMAYFIKKNQIDAARELYVAMDIVGLQMTPETFNIMLRGAAKSADLFNFNFILQLMLRRGCVPNAATWTTFMPTCTTPHERMQIFEAIKRKGLLRRLSVVRDICNLLMDDDIEYSLGQGWSLEGLLKLLDERYGPTWLSTSSSSRILNGLGSWGLIDQCLDFLHVMEARYVLPDSFCINLILRYYASPPSQNPGVIVDFLNNLPSKYAFTPNEATYKTLFDLAWATKHYNCARVIWRYACLTMATSRRMRIMVHGSLGAAAKNYSSIPVGKVPLLMAGPFIMGHQNIGLHPVKIFQQQKLEHITAGKGTTSSLAESSSDQRPASNSKSKSKGYFSTLELDYKVYEEYVPVKPFPQMLSDALDRDLEWKRDASKENFRTGFKNLEWMVDNGIVVPVALRGNEKREVMWK